MQYIKIQYRNYNDPVVIKSKQSCIQKHNEALAFLKIIDLNDKEFNINLNDVIFYEKSDKDY